MADEYNPDQYCLRERGCAIWPLGHGNVLTVVGLAPDGRGLFIMAAVPDHMLKEQADDWRAAAPGKELMETLLRGNGPAHIMSFEKPDDVQRIIDSLRALKMDMIMETGRSRG
jgi:hypothetical protein